MEVIEEEILAPLGYNSLQDFRANGRNELGPDIYGSIVAQIRCYESCEGGPGHSYPEPAVRFHGGPGDGWAALGRCIELGLKPTDLKRACGAVLPTAKPPRY
jgi:hypothetical protein